MIVLTGGPGGGKNTFLDELSRDPAWVDRFIALPEAISLAGALGISPKEKRFQAEMVRLQMEQEDQVLRKTTGERACIILCNRGSLDPLAYWLQRGWTQDEFFATTGTTLEQHYQRYAAVLHLVSAADGAIEYYKRYPDAHRLETPQQAVIIDRILQQVWSGHPNYFRIDNENCDWPAKVHKAREILVKLYGANREE